MKNFEYYVLLYKKYLRGLGRKDKSIESAVRVLRLFSTYVYERDLCTPVEISEKDITDFIGHLRTVKSGRNNTPYKAHTVQKYLSDLRNFFRYLYRTEVILNNPMKDMPAVVSGPESLKGIFTVEEMEHFLDAIDIKTGLGLRNRAIFELMYSSGIRMREVINLKLSHIDLSERIAAVIEGKGGKDRHVPFSETAALFLKSYIHGKRSNFLKMVSQSHREYVFLSHKGRIKYDAIRNAFKKTCEEIKVERENLTLHSIRHSCATHLLEAGADVRYVQELLGHENIETTVKYTHLINENVKRAYKSAHPRENQLYDEVDEEYLKNTDLLIKEIIKEKERAARYR